MQAVSDMARDAGARLGGRRAWAMWGLAAAAYLVAFFHRMALGVAGLEATERLSIPEGALASLAALQLFIYLAMQIPAGLAADRLGPRRTLAIGLAIMAVGEALFAVSTSLAPALAGRALVGLGDALTFLNVLRIGHAWFPEHRQGLLAALTGVVGAVGQLVATIPLHLALDGVGWTPTFLAVAFLTGALVAMPLLLLHDRPPGRPAPRGDDHAPIGRTLRDAWARPATRHGFFLHLGAMGPFAIVGAVWGVPYMVASQGMSRATASTLLLGIVVALAVTGPIVGALVGGDARRRRASVLVPAVPAIGWGLLVLWPTPDVPDALLLAVLVATGAAAGGSMIAFEIARREAPAVSAGSATALVNCGGFSAAVLGAVVVGLLLGGDPSPATAQHAMAPVALIAAIGTAGCVIHARRGATRRRDPEAAIAASGSS
ncbi:MFS transporter [Patulibacter brassicae]|uniref:MFS transporter n=1 Tax=Patulibacter brassicae TaxID=1705717 RepID=A0ABU4VIB5_9ACTN|nr:MFS transporter [Patulibacter brassicae]MDX8151567.1 MFS transporter [Patulibacter brassicae]